MRSRLVLITLPVLLLSVGLGTAGAAPKPKPFTATYEASAPLPGANMACSGTAPMARHMKEFQIPAAGALRVELSGFVNDWDLRLQQDGKDIAESQNIQPLDGSSELILFKVKKAGTIVVVACNYAGGPHASVEFSYKP